MKRIFNARPLAWLLTMILIIACFPVTALASGSIGLSASSPKPGRNKLSISWDKIYDLQFYAYSIRDLTTGDIVDGIDRVQTNKSYANITTTWEEGHQYRVWAGACCEGDDPNNTSSWSYSGTVTFTVEGCPHEDTDFMWDSKYSITITPVSSTKHDMSGYMYEYCVDCYERIGSSFRETERYSHNFDKYGDCPDCGYTQECQHKSTEYVIKDGYPSFKQYDQYEHIRDEQYEQVCSDCDKVLKYVVDSERVYEYEDHSFNARGKCRYCDYVKLEEQDPLELSVSANQSTAVVNDRISANAYASGGTGVYSFSWKVTCDGEVVHTTDMGFGSTISYTAQKKGSYTFTATVIDSDDTRTSASSASIKVSEPACLHTATDFMWDSNYSIAIKSISDTKHSMSGYMYEYCIYCYERISSKSIASTQEYPHSFDSAGDCPECGYTYSCKHVNTQLVEINGYPAYHIYDEEQHIYDVQFMKVCSNPDCGKTVNNLVDSERIFEYRAHRFGADGICADCDYVKPEDQKPLSVVVTCRTTSAKIGNHISARATASGGDGDYSYAWSVLLDSVEIAFTDLGKGNSYSVRADRAGIYTFTVTVIDGNKNRTTGSSKGITVTQAACEHIMCSEIKGISTYGNISDNTHKNIIPISVICDDCGVCTTQYTNAFFEAHTFVNGFCACGFAELCRHINTDISWDFSYGITCISISDTEHSMSGYQYKYCTACLERIGESRAAVENRPHNLDSAGDCTMCDYRAICKHSQTREQYEYRDYNTIDSTHHKAKDLYSLVCANPECNKVLVKFDSSLSTVISEEHVFIDGKCRYCYYVKAESLTVTAVAVQSSVDTGDDIAANAVAAGGTGNYKFSWTVSRDNVVIEQTDMSMGDSYGYTAKEAGTYVFSVMVIDTDGNVAKASTGSIIARVQHIYEPQTDSYYVNLNDNQHQLVTISFDLCTHCGIKTAPIETKVIENHAPSSNDRGREKDHPHKEFYVCICSARPYTGRIVTVNGVEQDPSECCLCGNHERHENGEILVGGEWREYCVKCNDFRVVEHNCLYILGGNYSLDHPHTFTGRCKCGKKGTIEQLFITDKYCCQCVGHDWNEPSRQKNNTYTRGCFRCNMTQIVSPSEDLEAYYKWYDIYIEQRENVDEYAAKRDLDNIYTYAKWKVIASQATEKLTEWGFTLTNESLNTFSDMSGSVIKVFTEDTWDEQKEKIWDGLLIQLLKDNHEELSGTDGFDAANEVFSLTSTGTTVTGLFTQARETQYDIKLNEFSKWIKTYEDIGMDADTVDGKPLKDLQELNKKYNVGKDNASNVAKGAEKIGYAMDVLKVLTEGTSAAAEVTARNDAIADIIVNGYRSIQVLDNIIENASDPNLLSAAEKMKEDLQKELNDETNKFLETAGGFFGGVMEAAIEPSLGHGIKHAVDLAIDKGGDKLLGAAGQAAKDSLMILELIELSAKGIKFVVGWDEAYAEAQELMTLLSMDSMLNISGTLGMEGSACMLELWGLLQMEGCNKANSFLQEWEDAPWLSTKEFGIGKNALEGVKNELNTERNYFRRETNLP